MTTALKDIYNQSFISLVAKSIQKVYPDLDEALFFHLVFNETWEQKTLKERMRHITICLHKLLSVDYAEAVEILKKVAPDLANHELAAIILPDYIEQYGLTDWEVSIQALEWFTQYSTAEFAVRPFIIEDQERMVRQMTEWSLHPNHRVRRLASEGIRPKLPWGMVLQNLRKDPTPIFPILNNLKEDESLFVRKSVANNLNDISKDHPSVVLEIVTSWYGKHKHTDWIVKHACRTLLKKGHPQALALFGFNQANSIDIHNFNIERNKVKIGEDLHFSFQVTNKDEQPSTIRIEFVIDYVKANGNRSKKVFKIAENKIAREKNLNYYKKISFKDLTTRKHYKGMHTISILVNGKLKSSLDFEVE